MDAFFRAAGKSRHMIIGRDVAVGMVDLDAAAIARIPSRADYGPIAGREDGRTDRRCPVHAQMWAGIAKDRMIAHAKTGGEPASHNRHANEKFACRAAVL